MEVVPDVVTKIDEYYGVNYSEFPALFIEAIKEQQKIIEKQQDQITALNAERQNQQNQSQALSIRCKDLLNRIEAIENQSSLSNR